MADFTALKTAIQNAIKQNGNEEITGTILQEVMLAVVNTLGDGAINDLVSALANEVTNRQNADGTLQTNINNEATTRSNADTALGTRIDNETTARENADTALSNRITAITDAIDNGYVYAGIATTSTEPATGKVFYLTTATGVFTNFGGITVNTKGIKILKKVESTWTSDTVIVMDDTPTENSTNLVKSGGVYASIASVLSKIAEGYLYVGIATAATNPSTPTTKVFYIAVAAGTYTNFLNSSSQPLVLTQGINILKYNGTAWSVEQVYGIDDEPTADSNNLVKSGGVYSKMCLKTENEQTLGVTKVFFDGDVDFNIYHNLQKEAINSGRWKTDHTTEGAVKYGRNNNLCPLPDKAYITIQNNTNYLFQVIAWTVVEDTYTFLYETLWTDKYIAVNGGENVYIGINIVRKDEATMNSTERSQIRSNLFVSNIYGTSKIVEQLDNMEYLAPKYFADEYIIPSGNSYKKGDIYFNKGITSEGVIANSSSNHLLTAKVKAGKKYCWFFVDSSNEVTRFNGAVAFYKADGTFISYLEANATTITAPENAAICRKTISYSNYNSATNGIMLIDRTENEEYTPDRYIEYRAEKLSPNILDIPQSQLRGKKIVNLGDSIFGKFTAPTDISTFLAAFTGAEVYNCAFGGTRATYISEAAGWGKFFSFAKLTEAIASGDFSEQEAAIDPEQGGIDPDDGGIVANNLARLESIDFNEVDIVTVNWCANDYYGSGPAQIENEEQPKNVRTFMGAYRTGIENLLNAYPNLVIVIIEPIYRFWFNIPEYTFKEDCHTYVNSRDLKLDDYIAAEKTVAAEYNLCILDTYNIGMNRYTAPQFFPATDGTHPNEEGRKLMARYISKHLY